MYGRLRQVASPGAGHFCGGTGFEDPRTLADIPVFSKSVPGKDAGASAKRLFADFLKAGPCAKHCVSACGFDKKLVYSANYFVDTIEIPQ